MSTVFEDAAAILFQDHNLFPETVTATPPGGSPKIIRARINRSPARVQEVGGRSFAELVVEVDVCNDATLGLTQIHVGELKLAFKKKLGDVSDTEFRVTKIVKQDEMSWKLEATA